MLGRVRGKRQLLSSSGSKHHVVTVFIDMYPHIKYSTFALKFLFYSAFFFFLHLFCSCSPCVPQIHFKDY